MAAQIVDRREEAFQETELDRRHLERRHVTPEI
jgi:hypothetical protein